MFGVIVRFPQDRPDREGAAKIAVAARGTFEEMSGLRVKAFAYDQSAGRATNLYLWQSEDEGRAFFTEDLRKRVTELYGAEPTIEFLEVLELVENTGD